MPLSEDFDRWRDDPMTRRVFLAMDRAEAEQKRQWDAASWGGQVVRADELERTLRELRLRADCYAALREMTWPDVVAWLELETNAE